MAFPHNFWGCPPPVLRGQGREGEIRHLFRGFAFLHCKKLVENGGMFVCKTRHLVLAGGSKVGTLGDTPGGAVPPPFYHMSPPQLLFSLWQPRDVTNFTVGGFAPMSPRISSPMHPSGAGERWAVPKVSPKLMGVSPSPPQPVCPPPGQRGGFGGGGMSRGRGRRDNDLIGQTVRISQGPYKGGWRFVTPPPR